MGNGRSYGRGRDVNQELQLLTNSKKLCVDDYKYKGPDGPKTVPNSSLKESEELSKCLNV